MWSAEEALAGDAVGVPVGVVYMFDPSNLTTLPIKVLILIVLTLVVLILIVLILIVLILLLYLLLQKHAAWCI